HDAPPRGRLGGAGLRRAVGHPGPGRAHPGGAEVGVGGVDEHRLCTVGQVDPPQLGAHGSTRLGHVPRRDEEGAVGGDVGLGLHQGGAGAGGEVAQLVAAAGGSGLVLRRRVCGRVCVAGRLGDVDPGQVGAQVVVPVPHRVLAVEDGADLALGPLLAQPVVLVRVCGGGQGGRGQGDDGGPGGGTHTAHPDGVGGEQCGLPARGGQCPDGRLGVVLGAALGDEEEVAVGREHRLGLARGAVGEAACRALAGRVHLPQGGLVRRPVLVQRAHRGDEPAAVGREGEPAEPGQGDVVVEVVEGGRVHAFCPITPRGGSPRPFPVRARSGQGQSATSTFPEACESRATAKASSARSAGSSWVTTCSISGRASSSATAASISSLKRKDPSTVSSLESIGARLMPFGSSGTIPSWTCTPARRAARKAALMEAGTPEHSRTTSYASAGSASPLTSTVRCTPSARARSSGPGSTSVAVTWAAPPASAAAAVSSPIGPEPVTSTRAPSTPPASVIPWSPTASGSASAARRSGSERGSTRTIDRSTSSSSLIPPCVCGQVEALPR